MQGLSIANDLDAITSTNNDLERVNSHDQHPLQHNFYNVSSSANNNHVVNLNPDNFFIESLQNLPCNKLSGLSKGQQQLCQLNKDHIPFVGRGARDSIIECQFQLKNSKWNCSTFDDNSVFGPILKSGESLFQEKTLFPSRLEDDSRNISLADTLFPKLVFYCLISFS